MAKPDMGSWALAAAVRMTNHDKAFALALPGVTNRASEYSEADLLDCYAIALVTKSFAAEAPKSRFSKGKNRALDEAWAMAQQTGFVVQTELVARGWSLDRIQAEAKPYMLNHMQGIKEAGI